VPGHHLRALVGGGPPHEAIEARLRRTWNLRDDRYSEIRSAQTVDLPKVEMSYIGG
jgi:cyclic pyranopterin phosphate synthase